MSYEIPSFKELWALMPKPCKIIVGSVVALALCFAILSVAVNQFADPLIQRWAQLTQTEKSPFELDQERQDAAHVGDPYQVIHDDGEARILLYVDPPDILIKHEWMGDETHLWKVHPKTYGDAPVLELSYGDEGTVVPPSAAGFAAEPPPCDPLEACLPIEEHPGAMRAVYESGLDECWVERHLQWFNEEEWTDGCTLAVPFNLCGNYYSWQQAAWLCCFYH